MRRSSVAALLAGVLLATIMAGPVTAQGATTAACTILVPVHFSPGITTTYGSLTVDSGGEKGSITCVGTINGHLVTGPGSFGFLGLLTGSCFSHTAAGTYSWTVPTDAGVMHYAGTFNVNGVGFTGSVHASQPEGSFTGRYVIVPAQDCLTAPVTDGIAQLVTSSTG
jgi:hypothetical protein